MSYEISESRRRLRVSVRGASHTCINSAIARGEMLRATLLKCVDCGRQATCYDHRDYSKPLDVDAVCRGCNNKRGPGAPYDGYSAGWQRRKEYADARHIAQFGPKTPKATMIVDTEPPKVAPRGRPRKNA